MLLERGDELAAIDDALRAARAGEGGTVVIEAAAGLGKTRLLAAARDRAAQAGMQVLAARGFELERQFTFGVLRQLYEPAVAAVADRDGLVDGAAALAGPAIGLPAPESGEIADPIFAVAHGVYWLSVNLAARGPLLIAVDDAQWADTASLRCLAYLAHRLDDLPAVLVAAVRPGEPDAPEDVLHDLGSGPAVRRLAPRPLTSAGTGALIAERMGADADAAFAAAAHDLTGGNPFFVTALAADLRDEGVRPDRDGARLLPAVTPDAVARSVLVRLSRLGGDAQRLAQAVAVLGDGAVPAHAAALADLDGSVAVAAADRLARADILRAAQPLAFTHPLVRDAVQSESPPHTRADLHARAARILDAAGASIERIGAQLLRTAPAGDPWVAERLGKAGESARARGDLESAIAFLARACDEPPASGERGQLLHLLGATEVRAGEVAGYDHLDQAAEAATDPVLRAAIEFDQARGRLLAGRPEAVAALERASAQLPVGERGEVIHNEAELIALGRMSPATAPLVLERGAALAGVAEREEPGWEAALGVLAANAYLANEPAERVADLARRSLDGRRASGHDPAESAGYLDTCFVLSLAGEYDEAEGHLDHAIDRARRANSLLGFSAAASFRAGSALRRGDLTQAEGDARMALEAGSVGLAPLPLPAAVGVLVEVLIERGELDQADALLEERGFAGELLRLGPFNSLAFARGALRLAQGRHDAALADLTATGESVQALCIRAPGPIPWRPEAALALAALGRRAEAAAMAAEGVALARAFGAPYDVGIALRAAGLIEGGEAGLALLEQAVTALDGSPVLLELARARTDYGAALRRAGRREAAREVLREALDGAAATGAHALADRARAELVTAGAKPRRERTSGVDALTASERRVAELAVEGRTNRQIAEALFVTTGTVEKHLAKVYGKLEIAGRGQLAEKMGVGTSMR